MRPCHASTRVELNPACAARIRNRSRLPALVSTPTSFPNRRGRYGNPVLRFLDATDIVAMQEALSECCELCGLAAYTNAQYPALRERLRPQLKYADRQVFEVLDKKMRRSPTQDASRRASTPRS